MRFEISFLLLWNRRSAFLQYCTLLFQKSECFDSPSDMAGQSWHVPTVQVDMCVVLYNVHTCHRHRSWPCGSTGPVPETPQKKFFQNLAKGEIWNSSYQKKFGKYFFGRGKMFAMPGVGPRPACHIPDPRDSWQQRTLWFSHVIVSRAANPALQWYLKIEFCCLESEIAFRDLIFASLEPQECIFTILHSFISKFGML